MCFLENNTRYKTILCMYLHANAVISKYVSANILNTKAIVNQMPTSEIDKNGNIKWTLT